MRAADSLIFFASARSAFVCYKYNQIIMIYDAEITNVANLNETVDSLINVFEDAPQGINIENFEEGDVTEGTLVCEPKKIKFLLKIDGKEIPKSIIVHKTFTTWYANDEYVQKTHGFGCDVGVDITVELINLEKHEAYFIGTYEISDIMETG